MQILSSFFFFFFFNDTATTEISPLPLPAALPILQELRAAIPPSCRRRQLRTPGGAVASSACIPFATATSGANAGLKTKARSFLAPSPLMSRSEEHTSELQSQSNLVCRLLLEKKNT